MLRSGDRKMTRACWGNKTTVAGLALTLAVGAWLNANARPRDTAHTGQQVQQSSGLTPQELFVKLSAAIFVVEVADENGAPVAQGSAVAVGDEELLTNKHVVVAGLQLKVKQGNRTWPASVLRLSAQEDLCLLSVQGLAATAAPSVRPWRTLEVGERVYAIGAPRGLELSLSEGLVSGIRTDPSGTVIQTTAAISPGSSGGGLFDRNGELVGVMTFFLRESQGLNFAIPAEDVSGLRTQSNAETAKAWAMLGDELARTARMYPLPPPEFANLQATWAATQRTLEQVRAEYSKAAHAYLEASRLDPDNADVLVKLGDAYANSNDVPRAEKSFQRALSIRPHDPSVYLAMGLAYGRIDPKRAFAACNAAIQVMPQDPELWADLADAYPSNHKREKLEALHHAESLNSPKAGVWWRMGLAYQSAYALKDAERCFLQAVHLEPKNRAYLKSLADLYLLRGKSRKAEQILEQLGKTN